MFKRISNCIVFAVLISGCATVKTGEDVVFSIEVETMLKSKNLIEAKCSLFSASSKLDFYAPSKIKYRASCSPINVFCKSGTLAGEAGIVPKSFEFDKEGFIISSGVGYLFDRAVDSITPFGIFFRYASSGDEDPCLIPKKIQVILE